GRFRSFLLASVKHFLAHEWRKAGRLKRGGAVAFISWEELGSDLAGAEPAAAATPDESYDRRWALAPLPRALTRVRDDFAGGGRARQFAGLKQFLSTEARPGDYDAVAAELGTSSGAVGVAVHRLRQHFAELAREEVANTCAHSDDVEEELRYLLRLASA